MSDTYTTIGDAIFEFMEDMDISDALPTPEDIEAPAPTWAIKLNRLPKANEISAYPAFAVTPARDALDTGDTMTDFDAIAYSVFVIVSAQEGDESESQLRSLADIVRTAFRSFRRDPAPLHPMAFNATFNGEWGGNADQGERWYRLDITTFVHETLESEEP